MARPRIEGVTEEQLEQIRDEYGYRSLEAAVRHVLREAGYEDA